MSNAVFVGRQAVGLVNVEPKVDESASARVAQQAIRRFVYHTETAKPVAISHPPSSHATILTHAPSVVGR